jgi:hypothetical protein
MSLATKKEINSNKKIMEPLSKRSYYAFLLDNIGPFPEEITKQLPTKVFDAIWAEFYHYLTLVAETALPGGSKNFIQYIESNSENHTLPNLSEITNYLALEKLCNYPDEKALHYWLNVSALLEYGCHYNNLSQFEKSQCERFEYLQELDHFSEIMDLSLLTKHLTKELNALPKLEKESFFYKHYELFEKYLGLTQTLKSDENHYKPIAGRSKHINLGLERMLGEAVAKRRNCHYTLYQNSDSNIGEFNQNYYPIKKSEKTEAQYKISDPASIGQTRTNYPYLSLLLTSNSLPPLTQDRIKELSTICSDLILKYGMEIGISMFDGYIFDNNYNQYSLSLMVSQVFKPNQHLPIQIKIMSIGPGAALIYQNQKIQHIRARGTEETKNYLGHSGTTQQREIILLNNQANIKILLAPCLYGLALHSIDHNELLETANKNVKNPLAWIMSSFIKPFRIPQSARNILQTHIKPTEINVIERPKWSQNEIKQIPEFLSLKKEHTEYLSHYKWLEINVLYAHLHADRILDIHQKISIEVALAYKNELEKENISFRLYPLIDNLHVRDVFDYKKYNDLLLEKNLRPDVILTEDSLLLDRIGQGILYSFINQECKDKFQIIFEGNRGINVLFPDNTVVQLIDHMDKEGRLSCITFDLAQIYYRQAPDLFENLFKDDIMSNYSNTTLGKWFLENPSKNYHEIMYDMIYSNPDIQYRNKLFQKITSEIRPNINKIEDTKSMRHYVDALRNELITREQTCSKKVISIYILEGSYDAQFDRYAKVHSAFALPHIDTYRITFTSEELGFNIMCIKS